MAERLRVEVLAVDPPGAASVVACLDRSALAAPALAPPAPGERAAGLFFAAGFFFAADFFAAGFARVGFAGRSAGASAATGAGSAVAAGFSAVLAGLALGSGEFVLWPYIIFKSKFVFFWACMLGVATQYFINMEVTR